LVERGHIYIAQPPLYKVKQGKNETYLKDDYELKQYLLRAALNGAEFQPSADAAPFAKESARTDRPRIPALRSRHRAQLSRRMDYDVLYSLLQDPAPESVDSEADARDSAVRLKAVLTGDPAACASTTFRMKPTPAGTWRSTVSATASTTSRFSIASFLVGGDYEQLARTATILQSD
jgi:DNA gyrase subunit B